MRLTWLLLIIILLIIAYLIRVKILYSNSKQLFDKASTFSTDYYLGNKTDPEITYVALGDSLTTGTGVSLQSDTLPSLIAQDLADKGFYVHVINKGKSGERINGFVQQQLPELKELNPDYVSITIGSNDATHFTPLDVYEQNSNAMLSQLSKLSAADILIANTTHIGSAPALPPLYARSVIVRGAKQNEILSKVIAEQNLPNIRVIDLYGTGRLSRPQYAHDLFHPNKNGYAFWAGLFKEKLDSR